MSSSFRLSVITDEISQDLGRALEVASTEFGLAWVELRTLWNKNILRLEAAELAEVCRLLHHYDLQVNNIASPLFKVDWPGAPLSQFSPKGRPQATSDFNFAEQQEVLERSLELAAMFKTNLVRCFDFWRLQDPAPYREAMDAKLSEAAAQAGKKGVTLILENEHECNTATCAEILRTLAAVNSPHFQLNWDPGNAAKLGDAAFPQGYQLLPKNRIAHVHCKNAERDPAGSGYRWAPVENGLVDWAAQFRALKNDNYRAAVSLETHWRGTGTAEQASRECWAQMRAALQSAGALS